MTIINDNLPTSTLLALKVGDEVTNGNDVSFSIGEQLHCYQKT
jgi:hypothetical protein